MFAKDEATLIKLTQQASKYEFATLRIMAGENTRRNLYLAYSSSHNHCHCPSVHGVYLDYFLLEIPEE